MIDEIVLNGLLEKIRNNEYKLGEFIPSERKLAEEYGVSRFVIKETINELISKGYLDSKPSGKRVLVRTEQIEQKSETIYQALEQSKTEEFLEARMYLDDIVITLACQRATEEDLDKITEVYNQLCLDCKSDKPDILNQSWTEFHMEIANATHNSVIKTIYHLSLTLMPRYREKTLQTKLGRSRMLAEHERIYLAIKAKNVLEARLAAQIHNRKVIERYREIYK